MKRIETVKPNGGETPAVHAVLATAISEETCWRIGTYPEVKSLKMERRLYAGTGISGI
ncbi:MAG: hypothetical protein JXL20_03660 [Deltaproteobacteria bacterium]|nr:hypothetical protein [Deltaproteobacteria bacterium]